MSRSFVTDSTEDLASTLTQEDSREPSDSGHEESAPPSLFRSLVLRLRICFFLFGTINNVLYVIILSAALDLVPTGTPKGIIAFCNIAPSLAAKIGWPYLLKGKIQYKQRIIGCCFMSVMGMTVVAAFNYLSMRLLGIALASLSSGLGELTFLQLSTTYTSSGVSGDALGYFASGTGCAGLLGAGLWWVLRGFGVQLGVGLSSLLPFVIPLAYFLVLPTATNFLNAGTYTPFEHDHYMGIPSAEIPAESPSMIITSNRDNASSGASSVCLTPADKWRLVRPLILRYMAPLFCVYTFEYTINQGISPTLIFAVPKPSQHPVLSHIVKSIRDYYPLWQLIYQTTVFLSRSSISLGLPPLPRKYLPVPAILQAFILIFLFLESSRGIIPPGETGQPDDDESASILWVAFFIAIEGICGGSAYVNAFYHVGHEDLDVASQDPLAFERQVQEREFKIGAIGLADTFGILTASLLAVPVEIKLCHDQISRGRELCRKV
ncbi:batten's disease protein Cln3 [Cantharellus anzutake]|uniref:batten's disease protein Cln3 n=1 Tax=Cantharellus anzutake TaxID=1750568 RepID=UPI00190540E5|nr:batten's disease protein Cln3 [Cantharellus anzutake]KAF8311520.1 batten's disease protein Cln3 [Cantharellus anzutake]